MNLPPLTKIIGLVPEKSTNEDTVKSFDPDKLGPKEVYIKWKAPSRLTAKSVDQKFSRTLIIFGVFVGFLLAFMGEYPLIFLIASLIFVNYALKKSSPDSVNHEINSHGFSYAGQLYYWHQLRHFGFQDGSLMFIDTYNLVPSRLFVIIDPDDKSKIKGYLEKHLQYLENVPKSSIDNFFDSIIDKIKF